MAELFIKVFGAVRCGASSNGVRDRSERGASMVEYALLVGLIAVVSVVIITALGSTVEGIFTNANSVV